MVVISDTSAITNLIKIEQLEILKLLFEEVIIPEAVI
jgi:predicted nucleic acid-binding protein